MLKGLLTLHVSTWPLMSLEKPFLYVPALAGITLEATGGERPPQLWSVLPTNVHLAPILNIFCRRV